MMTKVNRNEHKGEKVAEAVDPQEHLHSSWDSTLEEVVGWGVQCDKEGSGDAQPVMK